MVGESIRDSKGSGIVKSEIARCDCMFKKGEAERGT